MALLYANRIEREAGTEGAFTITNVPRRWVEQTLSILRERGLDGAGNKIRY